MADNDELKFEAKQQLAILKVEDLFALRQPILKISPGVSGLAVDAFDLYGSGERHQNHDFVDAANASRPGFPIQQQVYIFGCF